MPEPVSYHSPAPPSPVDVSSITVSIVEESPKFSSGTAAFSYAPQASAPAAIATPKPAPVVDYAAASSQSFQYAPMHSFQPAVSAPPEPQPVVRVQPPPTVEIRQPELPAPRHVDPSPTTPVAPPRVVVAPPRTVGHSTDSSTDSPVVHLPRFSSESTVDRMPQQRNTSTQQSPAQPQPQPPPPRNSGAVLSLDAGGMYRSAAASSSDASDSAELTATLARAVIKLGGRVTQMESKMAEMLETLVALQRLTEQLKGRLRP